VSDHRDAKVEGDLRTYIAHILRSTSIEGTALQLDVQTLKAALDEPPARIAVCVAAVGRCPAFRAGRKVWWRGVYASSKLLGCDGDAAAIIMRRAGSKRPLDTFWAKVAPECPTSAVGHVYEVECPDYPGVVKIGFSSQFDRRLEQLKREYKVPLNVKSFVVGTYLDEYLAQRALGSRWLVGEWFGSAENPDFCPAFIKAVRGAPVRETAERYLAQIGKPGAIPNTGPFRSPIEAEADERKRGLH